MKIKQIDRILIANRGEIASRVIKTCKKMGIESIAVYSDADMHAPYVLEADKAIHIGASSPAASYLDQDKILAAAKTHHADAIHPGYGFLSENADFVKRCEDEGIIFIGPNANAIKEMGSKSRAKEIMNNHGVPTIPGYQGADQSKDALVRAAKNVGFPLLLKATAGGGGKGMRIVREEQGLVESIDAAKREALSAFGNDELIIEKYIEKGRHIEFQIFGDQHGNAVHILERECTIQRRYQKVLEESPSPVLSKVKRVEMGAAAVSAAQALNYDNAGTVEFIFDEGSDEFYFLEVNTRLQVEHPVTEAITGLDLVQMQIEVAEGNTLSITQEELVANGYALEARLYAEDPAHDFRPVTGTILNWAVPKVDGLRIDAAITSGSEISIHYDPMIAKVIVHGQNRAIAHRKMAYALKHLKCQGLMTNQDFLLALVQDQNFKVGNYDTHFLQNQFDAVLSGVKTHEQKRMASIALCIYEWKIKDDQRTLLKSIPSGWRNSPYQAQQRAYLFGEEEIKVAYFKQDDHFEFLNGDEKTIVRLVNLDADVIQVEMEGVLHQVSIASSQNNYFLHSVVFGNIHLTKKERLPQKEAIKQKGGFESPMPSQIIKVMVEKGQKVVSGQPLLILMSMKMETTIESDLDGEIEEIYVTEGQNIEAGFLMLKIKDKESLKSRIELPSLK